MNGLTKSLILVSVLALGACTNPANVGGGGLLGGNSSSGQSGDVQDERSPAYFQSAVGDRVLFTVDEATLNEDARLVLLAQANWLLENLDYSAVIEGHADEQGTREYNLALGARRASAVHEFLLSRGVAADRLRTVSYGKERPIEVCSDEACYSQNRRAVTVLASGLSG